MAGSFNRALQIGVLGTMFAAGFMCGSVLQRSADAQVKELGEAVMKQAGESGGTLGSVTQLGSAIVDMQKHVDGLQKNIETLNKIKSALGG